MNLELRKDILAKALKLESGINDILLVILSINKEERRALTFKSGSLTFRNKIDLLLDLEMLTKDGHGLLLMLMEFRNQFMHNINCDSFLSACSFLGEDKKKRLEKFSRHHIDKKDDLFYMDAYDNAYGQAIEILYNLTVSYAKEYEDRQNFIINAIKYGSRFSRMSHEIYKLVIDFCKKNSSNTTESKETDLINKMNEIIHNNHPRFDMKGVQSKDKWTGYDSFIKENINVIKKIFPSHKAISMELKNRKKRIAKIIH